MCTSESKDTPMMYSYESCTTCTCFRILKNLDSSPMHTLFDILVRTPVETKTHGGTLHLPFLGSQSTLAMHINDASGRISMN